MNQNSHRSGKVTFNEKGDVIVSKSLKRSLNNSPMDPSNPVGFEQWQRLVMWLAKRRGARFPLNLSDEYSDGMLGLAIACKKFDGRCKFLKFATACIEKQILRGIEHRMAKKRGARRTVALCVDVPHSPSDEIESRDILDVLLSRLDARNQFIVRELVSVQSNRSNGGNIHRISRELGMCSRAIGERIRNQIGPELSNLVWGDDFMTLGDLRIGSRFILLHAPDPKRLWTVRGKADVNNNILVEDAHGERKEILGVAVVIEVESPRLEGL